MDVWRMVRSERRAQAEEASTFGDDDWASPTPCPAWTVRDVIAHLCQRLSPVQALSAMIRARFDRDRMVADTAIAMARRYTNEELVALLHARASSQWSPPGVSPEEIVIDTIAHAWDIRTALGRPVRERPLARYRVALDGAVVSKNILRGKQRARGLELSATDLDWHHGSGPVVEGPAEAVLATLVGRSGALDQLTGDGVQILRDRCGAQPS